MKKLVFPLTCLLAAPVLASTGDHAPLCQQVLGWLNDGSLASRLQPLTEQPSDAERELWKRLNPERALHDIQRSLHVSLRGRDMHLGEVMGGGSCADEQIEAIDRHNPESYPESEDDELRWSTWGTRDYLLKRDKELLIISGRLDAEHSQAKLVSRLADDGTKQPLCLFERQQQVKSDFPKGTHIQLCLAVRDGVARALSWDKPQKLMDPLGHSQLPGLESTPRPVMSIDLDGDGNDERLARYDYDSGAGCGSSSQHLLLVDKNNTVLPRTELNAKLLERSWGPLSDSAHRGLGIFQLEQQIYLLARLNWGEETLSLRALTSPQTELCHWRERPQYSLLRQY
ncbi:hypothetical protein [Pseudomonas sp. Gutcm_11s]|uniref:hypothetical protein n=1 Tax=Pseudomonas sp. Gutcm_11s TaxID=3026088 RepID=UPI00235EC6FB|nr:hypothetical protein [Pseudomonas sp. Gutcm_11s]MDD0844142.1 hypothetical protein [Pseudomonas sp. Gutcm_11s]